jgi:UDP-N-acetylmuramate--alanine ligase
MVSYGLSPQADIRAVNVSMEGPVTKFDLSITDRRLNESRMLEGFSLPMAGRHNLQNGLAAIAAGLELGVKDEAIIAALAGFAGVKRRFTHTGVWQGVDIYDDYAHHPVEIAAVLESARAASKGKVVAVVQPHRYSRLRDLFEDFCTCFNEADHVIVAPVYAAGEAPIEGFDAVSMADNLIANGHRHVTVMDDPAELASLIQPLVEAGDLVICLGAGSISQWAHELPAQLAEQEAGAA